jgi:hypothetical protein
MEKPIKEDFFQQESAVSTIWCQGQELHVKSNRTFNAYLLPRRPKLQRFRKSVNMTRRMNLPGSNKSSPVHVTCLLTFYTKLYKIIFDLFHQ